MSCYVIDQDNKIINKVNFYDSTSQFLDKKLWVFQLTCFIVINNFRSDNHEKTNYLINE